MKHATLSPKGMGFAAGILWGAASGFFALWVQAGYPGAEALNFMSQFYLGYEATLGGALMGAIWGFIDAGIGGWLFAKLYNFFA